MFLPVLGIEEVNGVFFAGFAVDETEPIVGEEEKRSPDGKVDACGEQFLIEEDWVAVAEGPEDVDARLGHSGVKHAGEEVGTLIHGVAGDEPTEAVGYDDGSTGCRWCRFPVAWETRQKLLEGAGETVWAETPVIPEIPDS